MGRDDEIQEIKNRVEELERRCGDLEGGLNFVKAVTLPVRKTDEQLEEEKQEELKARARTALEEFEKSVRR